jgi:hypothetical protein
MFPVVYWFLCSGCLSIGIGLYWFHFQEAAINKAETNSDSRHKAQLRLKEELELLSEQIHPYKKKALAKYQQDNLYRRWFYPRELLFNFDSTVWLETLNRGIPELLQPETLALISKFIKIAANYQKILEEFKKYALNDQRLLANVISKYDRIKTGQQESFTKQEEDYKNKIFNYNYQLHVEIIGDAKNPNSLYTAYHDLHKALISELNRSRIVPITWYYIPVNVLAWLFIVTGLFLIGDFIFFNYFH